MLCPQPYKTNAKFKSHGIVEELTRPFGHVQVVNQAEHTHRIVSRLTLRLGL